MRDLLTFQQVNLRTTDEPQPTAEGSTSGPTLERDLGGDIAYVRQQHGVNNVRNSHELWKSFCGACTFGWHIWAVAH